MSFWGKGAIPAYLPDTVRVNARARGRLSPLGLVLGSGVLMLGPIFLSRAMDGPTRFVLLAAWILAAGAALATHGFDQEI